VAGRPGERGIYAKPLRSIDGLHNDPREIPALRGHDHLARERGVEDRLGVAEAVGVALGVTVGVAVTLGVAVAVGVGVALDGTAY
jgi:hypothetical protein